MDGDKLRRAFGTVGTAAAFGIVGALGGCSDVPGVSDVPTVSDDERIVASPFDACERDDDCMKAERGCCERGDFVALARAKADAYRNSLSCPTLAMCPMILVVDDGRTAVCDSAARRCELAAPATGRSEGRTRR